MLYKLDYLLEQICDIIREKGLAYFYYHKELLQDKHYNCAYKILRYKHIREYSHLSVVDAIKCAEKNIEEMLKNYEKEDIEKYKIDIDYLAELSKRYNLAQRLDELNITEY